MQIHFFRVYKLTIKTCQNRREYLDFGGTFCLESALRTAPPPRLAVPPPLGGPLSSANK